MTFKLTLSFSTLVIYAIPQDLKQVHNMSKIGGITFNWKEVDCEQRNGVLLGYEIKLYNDQQVYTRTVVKFGTIFTILPQWKPDFLFPKAISVAAINEVGVGNHCPPVNINLSGQNKTEFLPTSLPSVK